MIRHKSDHLGTALIVLAAAALTMGVLTYFVVFFPGGSSQPFIIKGNGTTGFASSTVSTPSNTAASANPAGTGTASQSMGTFTSEYTSPYPVSWNEGHETLSITAASLNGNQLTLVLSVQMSNTPECVPLSLRLITDESGAQKAPGSPLNSVFAFPDTQSCTGAIGATYSEPVVFTIDPAVTAPFLVTTGGAANVFFQVATTTNNGIDISLPSHSG